MLLCWAVSFLFFMGEAFVMKNSFQSGQNFLLLCKQDSSLFPNVSFISLNILKNLCLSKKNPCGLSEEFLLNAIHYSVLFYKLWLSMKDRVTFVIFNKIQVHQFLMLFIVVYYLLCVFYFCSEYSSLPWTSQV